MAYNKRTWANGDIITEQGMNNIETGISEAHDEIETLKNNTLNNTTLIDDNSTATNKTWSSSKIDSQINKKAEKQELEVERQRINSLTTLSTGSTTGDAELIDARIGADGRTYSNLGGANRNQFKNSNNLINNILEEVGTVIDNNIAWELGTVLSNGYKADHAKAIRFVDFIYVSKGSIISLKQYGDDSYKLGVTGFSKPVHSKDNVLFASGWQKEDYIIPQDGYIKACIWYTNDVTDTSSSQAFNSIMFTKEIKNDVSSLKNDVDVLNNQLQYTDSINSAYFYEKIPDYYKLDDSSMSMYLNSRIMSILSSTSDYTILFYTDYHYAKNALNSHDIIAYIKDRVGCNDIVFGGDLLGLEATKEKANYAMTKYGNEVYNKFGKQYKFVFGNHDLNVAGASAENLETQRLSYNDVYEKLIFPNYKNLIFEKNDLTVNSDEWSRERLHYYYDNLKEKIRVIILDTGTTNDYLANGGTPKRLKYQYDWVADVLSKTPDGYSVIVFGHEFYYTYNDDNTPKISDYAVWLAKILKGAKNKETVTFTDYGNITYNYDFTNSNDINIIGMFSGHVHCDYMGVVEEINSVVTTCDAYNATNIHSTPMTLGDITEQAIDIITINKNKRTVTIHRIGAGERKRSFQY